MKNFEMFLEGLKKINEDSLKQLNAKGMTYNDFLKSYLIRLNKLVEVVLASEEPQLKKKTSMKNLD